MTTLFEELGGQNGIREAVTIFYDKVAADPHLAPYFTADGMPGQAFADFLIVGSGGPTPEGYEAPDLTTVHQPHYVSGEDFAVTDQLLADSFKEAGKSDDTIAAVGRLIMAARGQIVHDGLIDGYI